MTCDDVPAAAGLGRVQGASPRQLRNALRYVPLNVRHHWMQRFGHPPTARLDEASSARWFTGWSRSLERVDATAQAGVASPRTWLARVGWRRHGLLDPG